jgi:hypothetical protein
VRRSAKEQHLERISMQAPRLALLHESARQTACQAIWLVERQHVARDKPAPPVVNQHKSLAARCLALALEAALKVVRLDQRQLAAQERLHVRQGNRSLAVARLK